MRRCLNCMREYPDRNGDICPHCGYMDGVTQTGDVRLQTGTILQGRYIVGTVIRLRDIDIIYNGWDALFDRKVRIQEYLPAYCATRSGKCGISVYDSKGEKYSEGLELFYRQSRELIRLYQSPDIAVYQACFRENQTAYAVMSANDLPTLKEYVDMQGCDSAQAVAFMEKAFAAVMKCHNLGIYHGMLDMESFWVTAGGDLILKDFGGWRYVSGQPGIVYYGRGGEEADVYGLGCLFYEMLLGTPYLEDDKPEKNLLMAQLPLKKHTISALVHALKHDYSTVYQFWSSVFGNERADRPDIYKKRTNRKDNRESLRISRIGMISAAVIFCILLLSAVFIGAGVIKPNINSEKSQTQDNMVRVPNVVNHNRETAESMLRSAGLEMEEEKMQCSDEIPENMVSSQNIKENTLVELGTKIGVSISTGKEKAEIPIVTGHQREEALGILESAGFLTKTEEADEAGAYNTVLRISEKEGELVTKGTEIMVTVCVRKEKTSESKTTVPDTAGMIRSEIEAAFADAELQINWIEEYSEKAEGSILGTKPKEGEIVNALSYVDIRISVGEEKLHMVNVELETQQNARTAIEALGLKVGNVTEQYSDTVEKGKVVSQSVPRDAQVKKGDTVDLAVSLGKRPVKGTESEKQASVPPQTTSSVPPQTPATETSAAEPLKPETFAAEEETETIPELPLIETKPLSSAAEVGVPPSSQDVKIAGPAAETSAPPSSPSAEAGSPPSASSESLTAWE